MVHSIGVDLKERIVLYIFFLTEMIPKSTVRITISMTVNYAFYRKSNELE